MKSFGGRAKIEIYLKEKTNIKSVAESVATTPYLTPFTAVMTRKV
jgi:hypothetical protein